MFVEIIRLLKNSWHARNIADVWEMKKQLAGVIKCLTKSGNDNDGTKTLLKLLYALYFLF